MTPQAQRDRNWNEALAASVHATVFGDARYVRAMAKASELAPEFLLEDSVGVAVCTRSRGPVKEAVLPLFTPFTGFVLPEIEAARVHAGDDALSRVATMLETGPDRIRVHLPPSVTDVRSLSLRGWNVSPLYTYRLNPANGTTAWSSGTRRSVRKNEPSYATAVDPEAVPEVIRLVHEGYERGGAAPPGQAQALADAVSELAQHGLTECVTARRDGTIEAGIVLLHGPDASYYWMAGSVPGPAMSVLIAFVLSHLEARGVGTFDLLGANTPPIAEFKRRLGAELVQYWSATFDAGLAARAISAAKALRGR
ncbi:MAG: GNAT family N-acetyltransferase [Rhodothermales bacterium]|nr:GNAT family N-acetyltransferase [Rhodothermales bacterium]